VNGETVFSATGKGPGNYGMSGFEPGIYFVKVFAGKRKFSKRIMIF
jgi:hypothetical protein